MDTVTEILDTVAATASEIRAGLPERRHRIDAENPSGDDQLRADVWADRLLADRLTALDGVGAYASEERDAVVASGEGLSVAVDPLDGSKNLRSNNALGTVLGVYDDPLPASGRSLVAAAYVLYGPLTTMTVADGNRVTEYAIEDGRREVLREDVCLPDDPAVYGFGGRVPDWTDGFAAFVRDVEDAGDLKVRYAGSMVGDVNQVLTFGGVFAYPSLVSRPAGKLRLQFEANPVAYVVETAGGRASDGTGSVLDATPRDLHQRTPLYLGNGGLVEGIESSL